MNNNGRDPYDEDEDEDDDNNDILSPSSSFVGKQKHTTDKQDRKETTDKDERKNGYHRESEKYQTDRKNEKIGEKNTDKMKQSKISSLVKSPTEKQDKESEKTVGGENKVRDPKSDKSASQQSSSSVDGNSWRRSTSTSPTKKTSPSSSNGVGAKPKSDYKSSNDGQQSKKK